jgi:HlyD family secretion protein
LPSGSATQRQVDELAHQHESAALNLLAAESNVRSTAAEIDVIDANIAQVKRKLQDCYPVSPVGGTAIEKFVEAGELLSAGRPIVKLAQLDTMWVKVYLPASDFAQVKIGDTVTVDAEAGGEPYRGTIIWTADEAEFTPKNTQTKKSRANLVYAVKVLIHRCKGKHPCSRRTRRRRQDNDYAHHDESDSGRQRAGVHRRRRCAEEIRQR